MNQPFAYAPLAPIAAAATIGMVVDRIESIPLPLSLAAATLCIIAWLVCRNRKRDRLGWLYLWACWGCVAGAWHHLRRDIYPESDVGGLARDEPILFHARGILLDEPRQTARRKDTSLVSYAQRDAFNAVIELTEYEVDGHWRAVTGKAVFHVEGRLDGPRVGDEIEFTGWLSKPLGPMNPGEADQAARLLDQRIRAIIRVRKSGEGVVRIAENQGLSLRSRLALLRTWGVGVIHRELPPDAASVASALLLGETNAMASDEWEVYIRTGVIHVLAISGQHLVVLGAFLWLLCRLFGVRRRPTAFLIAGFMLLYALLTGGRPSAMRAAVMVAAYCGGIILRRPSLPANTFALAWLMVLAFQPTDLFTVGFQLSFLCVAVLIWGIPRWFPPLPVDPLDQLIDESRPGWERRLRSLARLLLAWWRISLILMLTAAPLVMHWQNVVAPIGALIGPIMIALTSIALVAGFLTLLLSLIAGWAAFPAAWVATQSIDLAGWVVHGVDRLPGACWYVPSPPLWWLIGAYGVLIGWIGFVRLNLSTEPRRRFRFVARIPAVWLVLAMSVWVCAGLAASTANRTSDELRVTFLHVGHGGCIVMEMPDGRVLLYDAGAISGPDVTRRQIAPYLWSRGISRIDELFLSHADLDHFNGLPALLDRFAVGRITITPSFESKSAPGVRAVMQSIRGRGVAIRETQAGDRFTAGDVAIEVLHPPGSGPEGLENVRSLVLLIEHEGRRILFTGDLEKVGLQNFLAANPPRVDVLMAPHHGSPSANPPELADKTRPRLVIACNGPRNTATKDNAYTRRKIPYWGTWPHGAITLHSRRDGLVAETYRTGQRMVVAAGRER